MRTIGRMNEKRLILLKWFFEWAVIASLLLVLLSDSLGRAGTISPIVRLTLVALFLGTWFISLFVSKRLRMKLREVEL